MTAWLEQPRSSRNRRLVVALFLLVTAFMVWSASRLRIDAGFTKLLPLKHEYMQTYVKHREEFGGANRVLIALVRETATCSRRSSSTRCSAATDDVFFLPGVDRGRVQSLFTPNVRYTEVVEDGIAGRQRHPRRLPSRPPRGSTQVRQNILKSGIVGRLVANDFSAAIDQRRAARGRPRHRRAPRLHRRRRASSRAGPRASIDASDVGVASTTYHIIGFAKVIGDIAAGAARVVLFFVIAFLHHRDPVVYDLLAVDPAHADRRSPAR